jgi:hypothetical protein
MGAQTFGCRAKGVDASEAFANAREEAQWEHGHGGYSGTIAEKSKFKLVTLSEDVIRDPALFNAKLDDLIDDQFSDKWGPAGCVKVAEGEYYFFGWASS